MLVISWILHHLKACGTVKDVDSVPPVTLVTHGFCVNN